MRKTELYAALSETTIINRIISGDTALFEILIRRYNGVLYKIARSYGFNHQDAEDLMQETHIAAYLKLNQFEGRAAYKTWLSKIMSNKCLYKLSHGVVRNEQPDENIGETANPLFSNTDAQAVETIVMKREFSNFLEASLNNLAPIYRTVFVLREIEGFSVAETAELLNISEVNVKVRLNRAKTMLQEQLQHLYSSMEIYEFNRVYCDRVVNNVFKKILAN
ncbi:sigma-70 family RNA polymerase sigma factor [Flavisolibacter ginsenosidimutans]|uniref:Sigma-70 family RNA polymerase sigma factor n=1 Tax=Flavisolibacter ginsenosidimutans TaxID=661481 RepID=A0A5B8UFS5_9BACT|nr:sigma-70 family RNA polymerase sigma factor [Flavisolibacter ginsenosidimutans]QEC55333.1 sigma-70 family RNA polymerase sigma factor [Flavisolibacter ginsenosidimutans]